MNGGDTARLALFHPWTCTHTGSGPRSPPSPPLCSASTKRSGSRPARTSPRSRPTNASSALREVSLSLRAGTLTALTGPSGSGKSTLLHLIAGLERVDAGTLEVLGHQVRVSTNAELSALRLREIGFVHQDFSLLAALTLAENVRLPLEATGTPRGPADRAAREAMARVGLAGLEDRFPAEVSGGQQQRAAIARAIVGDRNLVLADEPTGSLDSKTGVQRPFHRWSPLQHGAAGSATCSDQVS
ncbi:ABC transporter ATP-binding protein [Streptomyces sp. NPDC058674]|uniref:ABC transporter ATP-binding protein n=1 Tax=Streptomyces sp. NPDC058674 TaxID=3346592 RepID=UPI00365DBC60